MKRKTRTFLTESEAAAYYAKEEKKAKTKNPVGRPRKAKNWTRFHIMLDQALTDRFNAFLAANPMSDKVKIFRVALDSLLTSGGF